MKIIDEVKNNLEFRPYFLWYLKTKLFLPKMIKSVLLDTEPGATDNLELFLQHRQSSKALVDKLSESVPIEFLHDVIDEVGRYYVLTLGIKVIKEQSNELLVLFERSQHKLN